MKKLLIVEDDVFLIRAYKTKLAKTDLEVKLVIDGQQAIDVLPSFRPDIILLDIVMPRKDGIAFLQEIKAHPEFKHIPVVVASNMGQKSDVAKIKGMGAAEYLIKTDFSLDQLFSKIYDILNKHTS